MTLNLNALFLGDLTSAEGEALRAYKAASDDQDQRSQCFDTNRLLRSSLTLDEMPSSLSATVRSLDTVFGRCPVLPTPLTVYRGTDTRAFLQGTTQPGTRFRALEFWSTSHVESCVERFIGLGGALIEIELPTGMPLYNMETLAGAGGSENEMLLPRGILWEMMSAEQLARKKIPPLLAPKMTCPHHNIASIKLRPILRTRTI